MIKQIEKIFKYWTLRFIIKLLYYETWDIAFGKCILSNSTFDKKNAHQARHIIITIPEH